MSRPSKRLRTKFNDTNASAPSNQAYRNSPLSAATEDDRRAWNGFCEIESEPVCLTEFYHCDGSLCSHQAFFNAMLKQFGVEGVKVREVVTLDEDFLRSLP